MSGPVDPYARERERRAAELRAIRLRAGLTQSQFAGVLTSWTGAGQGVSQQFVSQMERGERPVPDEILYDAIALDPDSRKESGEHDPDELERARRIPAPRGPYR